jgi:protein SCO1/2
MTRQLLVSILAALIWELGLAAAPAATTSDAPIDDTRPPILREIGFDQKLGAQVPLDTVFRDESGASVRLGDYFGQRPVILALVYYECPMLCTLTLNGMVSALGILRETPGREYEVVTVSINPRETPALASAKKATYLSRFKREGVERGWHFLTGEEPEIKRLADAIGFRYAWDAETQQFAHAAGIVVVTPEGTIARYLYGFEFAPKDIRFALIEASAGRIGSPVDQLILSCYHYDPTRGRYGVYAVGLVRIFGALTVVLLGGFIAVMLRRDRVRVRKERVP